MVAVSNTSPLRYLIAAGNVDILHRLFGKILAPQGVADEMCDPAAPAVVRKWILSPPAWLNIVAVSFPPDESLLGLDRGEREAIQLALERKADILIMDEWKGRTVVQRLGLPLTGALGVLGSAYQQRLIENPLEILTEMRGQGFRLSDQMILIFKSLLETRFAR